MWENISDMAGKRLNIGSTRRLQAGIVVLRSTTYRSPSKLLKTVALKIVRQVKVRYENWAYSLHVEPRLPQVNALEYL